MAEKKEKRLVWSSKKVEEAATKLDEGYVLSGYEIPFFEKKPGHRKANLSFKLTDHELDEYIKCSTDIKYFMQNYCFIKSEDGNYHIMKLRDYQDDIIDLYHNNPLSILMSSRQSGKCLTYNSVLNVMDKQGNQFDMRIGELYFKILKKEGKLTFLKYIKKYLYDIAYFFEKMDSK